MSFLRGVEMERQNPNAVAEWIPAVKGVREGDDASALRQKPSGDILAGVSECPGDRVHVYGFIHPLGASP